jgi:hypothetical protein
MRALLSLYVVLGLAVALSLTVSAAEPVAPLLETLRSVKGQGAGNAQASAAWQKLKAAEPASLPAMLAALDGAEPLAANWIRAAIDSVAEGALAKGQKLPGAELEKFVLDVKHDARARRLAFEWLVKSDETATARLTPGMLNDPSVELRRDAVAVQIAKANKLFETNQAEAKVEYRKALDAARDEDQITAIVKRLGELKESVDLQVHFGLIAHWKLVGPFDNGGNKGFAEVYPPEKGVDLTASYQGKDGPIKWEDAATGDKYGILDLNKVPSQKHKGAVSYAWHEFTCDQGRPVELRLGTPNAWKVWLNGKLLFGREEYHRGMALDQYHVTGMLQSGKNQILVKLCQNEQTEDWAQRFQLQLRVCDATGTAVLSTTRPPTPPKEADPPKEDAKK